MATTTSFRSGEVGGVVDAAVAPPRRAPVHQSADRLGASAVRWSLSVTVSVSVSVTVSVTVSVSVSVPVSVSVSVPVSESESVLPSAAAKKCVCPSYPCVGGFLAGGGVARW